MVKHTISMPESMSEYILSQISSGQYGNISEFFRDLIRKDQEKKSSAILELRKLIEEAESSGVSSRSLDDIWNGVKEKSLSL